MKIALLRPSRGLLFAESEDSCSKALAGYRHERFASWDQPIPDCFNSLVERFLASDCTHALIVEEDVVIPSDAVKRLAALKADIAAINYWLKLGDHRVSEWRYEGALVWVSLGCTLIRREVFEQLQRPWFTVDRALALIHDGSSSRVKRLGLVRNPYRYGGHDQVFCFLAKQAGFKIKSDPGPLCRHLLLEALGTAQVNDGCHRIADVGEQRECDAS